MSSQPSIQAGFLVAALVAIAALCPVALPAEEHIVLTNGFELNCSRHEMQPETGKVRIYSSTQPSGSSSAGPSYMEVAASSIRLVEAVDTPPIAVTSVNPSKDPSPPTILPTIISPPIISPQTIPGLLAEAGARHHIDVDLLASLVHAESGGNAAAVSRAGARGLMQLMPATAASLGVRDSFLPEQNIAGGTAYLDQLLTRFHDDLTLALAAYNAGPGAVDRWHGVPPYRETRAYVARIVKEYNRRKLAAMATH